jgi:hypothetical protein
MTPRLKQLKDLLDSGEFHHASYRSMGTLWEGLWIYRKAANGFRGYEVAGLAFMKNDPELQAAENLVGKTGISVGSYGKG